MPPRRRLAAGIAAAFSLAVAPSFAVEPSPPPPAASSPAAPANLAPDDLRQAAEWEKEIVAAYLSQRFDAALATAEKLEALYQAKLGADHWRSAAPRYWTEFLRRAKGWSPETFAACETARKKSEAAAALEAAGDFGAATTLRRAYLEQVRAVAADLPEAATAAGQLANNLYTLGKYTESEALLREALSLRRKLFGDLHPETAAACNNLAVALNSQGKLAEGEPLLREALEVRVRLFGEGAETATNFANLAACLAMQGKGIAAEALQRKALALREKAYGEDALEIAGDLNNLAGRLNDRAAYAEAEALYRRALAIRKRANGPNHPETALAHNNLGLNRLKQGMADEAAELFRAALRAIPKTEEYELLAALFENNLGVALQAVWNERYEAAQHLRRALEIRRQRLGPEHRDTLTTANNLADCEAAMARPEEAEKLHREVLAARERLLGPDHLDVAASCNNLAAALELQKKIAEGEPLHRRALAIFRRVHGEDHPDVSSSYVNLACTLAAVGKSAEAAELCEKGAAGFEAARLAAAAEGLDRVAFGVERSPYRLLATLRRAAGNAAGAWEAVEADLARGALDEAARRRGSTLAEAEQAESERLRISLAKIQERLPALTSLRAPTPQERAEEAALVARRQEESAKLHRIAVAAARRETAALAEIQAALPKDAALVAWLDWSGGTFDVDEHWGVVLRSEGDPVWVKLPGTGEDGAWTESDSGEPYRLFRLLQRSKSDSLKLALHIESTAERVREQRLAPLEAHVSKPLDGVKRLFVVATNRMAGVPIELLSDRYVVSYVPSGTYLARVRNRPKAPGPAELLAVGDPIFRLKNTGGEKAPEVSAPGQPGPGLVVAQVEAGGAASVAGVTAGDRLISYADVELVDAAQLAKLVAQRQGRGEVALRVVRKTSAGPQVLALAAAGVELGLTFEPQAAPPRSVDPLPDDDGWPELPGTAVELSRLKSLFGDGRAEVLQGLDASLGRLEGLRTAGRIKDFRYLHFATHGAADEDRPFGSKLILAAEAAAPKPAVATPGEASTPAGADRGGRSGAGVAAARELTARDVLDGWKLDADLVTLSACESGLGSQGGGEGLLGFAQAFLLAGGRSVCLSLWKVDDAATALLMDRFYQNLLGRRPELAKSGPLSKAEALAEAKRWLRNLPLEEAKTLTATLARGASRGKGQPALKLVEFQKSVTEHRDPKSLPRRDEAGPNAAPERDKPFAHPRYWAAFILVGEP